MSLRPSILIAASLAGAVAALPSSASAAVGIGLVPQSLAATVASSMGRCDSPLIPATGAPQSLAGNSRTDKISALLGGQPSRLQQIVGLQGSQAAGLVTIAASPAAAGRATANLAKSAPCLRFALPSTAVRETGLSTRGAHEFLASKRLPIRRTSFDAAWSRVARQGLSRQAASGLAAISGGKTDLATLAAVNSWANSKIRYVEDSVLYGKADYWASAGTTLKRGAGDCEDIAIAKLQLLAALGVPRSDMYLTVARDLARNADHAVLVVTLGERTWLLDNSTNQLLDASASYDYRPIMSFSSAGKWLHGYSSL